MSRHVMDSHYHRTPKEGSVWERTRKNTHETTVKILKILNGSRGQRYLVQGVASGRQWTLSHVTLIDTYRPKTKA